MATAPPTRPDDPPPLARPLDYHAPPPRRSPATLILVIVAAAVIALVLLGLGFVAFTRTVTTPPAVGQLPVLPPTIPAPGERQMRQTPLPPEGHAVTVKQREGAWLPGGNLKLSADDITGGQVLVSIAAKDGTVVFGPRSVREGEAHDFADTDGARLRLEVARLRNFLTGDDFAEFKLTIPDATTTRPALSEAEKVERLLARVAALEGARFLRNGEAHTASEAVEHLRAKWRRAGGADDPNATASQFIDGVASKSSLTGAPYRLRLADGREVESAAWLAAQLRLIEAGR